MIFGYLILTLFVLLDKGVFGDTAEVKSVSVLKGNDVTLENKEKYEVILWHFNDTRIAQFDQDVEDSCLYDGEGGTFRDRLKLDYETGSLTVTNITTEHTGYYQAVIIRREQTGVHYSLHISKNCVSTKITKIEVSIADYTKTFLVLVNEYDESLEKMSPMNVSSAPAGIVAGVVVLVAVAIAAGVIYHKRRSSRKDKKGRKQPRTCSMSL